MKYLQATQINKWGKENGKTKRVTIHHAVHSSTTLFIEYLGAYPQTHGSYIINNDPKFDSSESKSSGFSVGSRYDNTRFLQGEIASIEIYHGRGKKQIPQAVKDLVIKNQVIGSKDIADEEPPPVKKKKI